MNTPTTLATTAAPAKTGVSFSTTAVVVGVLLVAAAWRFVTTRKDENEAEARLSEYEREWDDFGG